MAMQAIGHAMRSAARPQRARADVPQGFPLPGIPPLVHDHPVDAVGAGMEAVEAELMPDEKQDQQAAGQTHGQADDVDRGEGLVPAEITESDF
jgi:hypothetical protein